MSGSLRALTAFAVTVLLAACATPAASPTATPTSVAIAPTAQSATLSASPVPSATPMPKITPAVSATATAAPAARTYAAKTVDGGSVSVTVTPLKLAPGAPVAFDVAMNTHSVELKDDLLRVSVLRDDRGSEVQPVAWEGAGPGGHHREGTLKFPSLSGDSRTLTLVLKNIAGIPERKFQWELAN